MSAATQPGEAAGAQQPVAAPDIEKKRDAIRIGVCGLGRAGLGMVTKEVAPLAEAKIVAGFDLLAERAEQLREATGATPYTDFEALLADPGVEVVVIATRSHEHVPMSIRALQAGKHVVVEKPIALDLASTDELVTAAKGARAQLFVRHNRRFDAPLLVAKEILASGKIGEPFQVKIRQVGYQRRADWQTLRKYGGGQMLNWGPHCVDWAMQLIGSPAAEVWGDLRRVCAAGDAEDHVKILIRGENGVVADVEISGGEAIGESGWVVHGSLGAFSIAGGKVKLRYLDKQALRQIEADEGTPNGYGTGEKLDWREETFDATPAKTPDFWVEVYRTLREGKPFPITLDEARENMRVIELARQSARF